MSQQIVTNTINVFDAEHAGKAVYSALTRSRLIDKWLTKERVRITIYRSFIGVNIKVHENSETCFSLDKHLYNSIIEYAKGDALDSIILELKHSQNKRLQKRINNLQKLTNALIPSRHGYYSNRVKSIMVEYACKTNHFKLQDYEAYVQSIQAIINHKKMMNEQAGTIMKLAYLVQSECTG